MGLQAGRADMVFYYNGKATMIELKTPDGSQTPAQKKWEGLIREQGFDYYIIRSEEEFKALIQKIIK